MKWRDRIELCMYVDIDSLATEYLPFDWPAGGRSAIPTNHVAPVWGHWWEVQLGMATGRGGDTCIPIPDSSLIAEIFFIYISVPLSFPVSIRKSWNP